MKHFISGALTAALLPILNACGSGNRASVPLTQTVLEPVVTVGVADGPPEQVIGRIIDLKAVGDGSFLVLDYLARRLAWFDQNGGYRGGITARGEGPGELSGPTAIAIAGERVAVMDPRNTRLNLFRLGPDGIEFRQAFRGAFSSLDAVRNLCSLSDQWYVRSRRDGRMIHAIDSTGSVVRSFQPEPPVSEEFGPFAEVVRAQKSGGHILCVADPAMIVSIELFSPTVRAYTPAGELVWESQVRNIRPIQFQVSESGELGFEEVTEEGSHLGRSVVLWSDRSVLVQYAVERPGPKEGDYHGIESIELALSTGEELGRSDALPLIGDTTPDFVYGFRNEPFPQVMVYRRGN